MIHHETGRCACAHSATVATTRHVGFEPAVELAHQLGVGRTTLAPKVRDCIHAEAHHNESADEHDECQDYERTVHRRRGGSGGIVPS